MGVGRIHTWKTRTEEGRKREVRAHRFGKRWTIKAQVQGEEEWTILEQPPLEDLEDLLEILFNKYKRHRVSWEHVAEIDRMVKDRGGEGLDIGPD